MSFPEYTQLPNKLIQDVRRISCLEGTLVRIICKLNKPVTSATLVGRDGFELSLAPVDGQLHTWQAELVVEQSARFELHLVDQAQRRNQSPPRISIRALPNQQATIKVLAPARDLDISPIEEVTVTGRAWDDFGLYRVGIQIAAPGVGPQEIVLGENQPGRSEFDFSHLLAAESMQLKPNDLVTWYLWVEDRDSQGQIRADQHGHVLF